ncbi:killer cell lectin-like receptor subfamily B member 1A [Anolis carolinensis]|uniref:killer cell lectin-like receptor subfamily B member 1A n=1 Tax=Anolis carolinensis TaxID=28377 RepID=UPI002F2B5783
MSLKANNPSSKAKRTRKGPAFWTDETGETQKVRRDPFVPLAQPAWEIQDKVPPPPKFFGLVSWWQLTAVGLVLITMVLFFFLIHLIAVYMVEADTIANKAPMLDHSKNRLKEAVRWYFSSVITTLDCRPCPDHWLQWGDNCYLGTSEMMSWEKCIPHCETLGASLLMGRTEGEMAFLIIETEKWLAEEYQWRIPGNFWIGLKYNSSHGSWQWMDGSNLHLRITEVFKNYLLEIDFCVLFGRGTLSLKTCNSVNHCLCKKTEH